MTQRPSHPTAPKAIEASAGTPRQTAADVVANLGPEARLIINGAQPADLSGPGPAPGATLRVIPVDGQSFAHAARINVPQAVDPVWNAQLVSPNSSGPIRAGDVLFGMYDVRGESKTESGGGQFSAWLQAPNLSRGWTELRRMDGAPGNAWSRRYFSAVATQDFEPGDVNLAFHLGVIPQTVDFANLMLWNLGPNADLDALPRTRLTYKGQEPDAPWRAEAMRRIDQHRKADLLVEVVDTRGRPVRDASVDVELIRHAFGFGTFMDNDSPVLQDSPDADRFREILRRYHNRLTAPSYAAQTWGWPDPSTADRYVDTMGWAVDEGFTTKAHCVLWSRFDWSPAEWSRLKNDPRALRRAMEAYVRRIMPILERSNIDEVDFWNEPASFTQIDEVVTDPGLRADMFKLARSLAPSVRLIVNEHTILSAGGTNTAKQDAYAKVIQDLINRDAPLEGIGMQAHMGEDFTPPTRLWEVLDRFAEFGLPIQITEFDVNTEDTLTQADYTRDFILAMLAHPAVDSFTTWGFWGGKMWIPGAEMWDEDWSIRPNGVAFVELITETLHTHEQGTTDRAGEAVVRGFHGEYRVTASHGGKTADAAGTLGADGGTIRVVLD